MSTVARRPPDVVFIGLYRAGSTTLRAYFDRHPGIVWTRQAQRFLAADALDDDRPYPSSVPDDAEGKCFIDVFEGVAIGYVFAPGHEWARVGFVPGAPIDRRIVHPDPVAMARRVHAKAPDVKILLMIRNQIDWLRSGFIHHLHFVPPRARRFSDFLNTLEGKCALFAALYHQTIGAYYEVFGRQRVKVLLLEAMAADMAGALRDLCAFLGVEYLEELPECSEWNQGRGLAAARAFAFLSRQGLGDGTAERLAAGVARLAPLAGGLLERDLVSPDEKAMLRAFYAASNYHTVRLTGLDLGRHGYPL